MGIIRYSIIPWIVTNVLHVFVYVSTKCDGSSMLPSSSVPRPRSLRKGFLSESSIYNHHATILEKNRTKSIEQPLSNTDEIRGRHLDDNGGGCDRYLQTQLGDTIGSYGQMFNIRPKEDRITITGFEFYTDLTDQWGKLNYFLFSRDGTYQTAQSDLTKWSLVANGTVAGMGKGNPTPIPETLALPVFPGGVRAFYFTLTRADLRYRYGNGDKGDEEIQIANNDFEIYEGIGVLSFPVKRDFSEGSRDFLGGIRYKTFSPCDANDPDQDDPTILTTVVSLTFFIEHSNRLNLLSLVTQTNQNVETTLQNLLSSSAGLASYADLYDMQLDKVESFLLQADENAPPCITTEAASTCSVIEAIVTSKHNDEIDTDLVKKVILDQGEPLSANMNYKALYIGLSYLDTTKILTLVGTQGTMDTNSISIFQSQMIAFLKPFLDNGGIDIRKVVVKDQTFVPNSQLRHGNIFAPDNRRRHLQNEYGRNTVTFLVIAEYTAPPKKIMSGIVDEAIEASGENFILAARGKPGGQYFNDVYLTNPIVDLEESDDEGDESEEDDDSSNNEESGGGSGSSAGMIIGILACFLVVAGGGFLYYRRRTEEVEEKLALIKDKINDKVAKSRKSARHKESDAKSDDEKRKSDDKRRRSRRRSTRHRRKTDADSDDEADDSNRRRRRRRSSRRRRSEKKSGSEFENEDKKSSSRRRRSSTKTETSGDKGEKEKDKRRGSKREESDRSPSRSPDRGRTGSDSEAKFSQDESKRSSRNTKMKRRDSSPGKSVASHSTTSPESSSGRNGEEGSDRKPTNAESSDVSENMSSHHRSNRSDNNNNNNKTSHIILEESSSDENPDDEQRFDFPPEDDTLRSTKERSSTGNEDSAKPLKASTDRGPIRDRIKDLDTEDESDRRRSSTSRPDRAFQSEHRRSSKFNSSQHRRSLKDADHSQHQKSRGACSEHRRSTQKSGGRAIQSEHLRRSTATLDDDDKKDSENSEEDAKLNSGHGRKPSATLRRAASARYGQSEHARRSSSTRNDRMYNSEHRRSTKPESRKVEGETSDEGGSGRIGRRGSEKKEDTGNSDVDEKKKEEEVFEEKEEERSDGSSSETNDEKEGEQKEEESARRRRSERRPREGVDKSSSSRRPRGTSRSRPSESDHKRSSRGVSRQRRAPDNNGESDVEGGGDGGDRTRQRSSRGVSRQRRTSTSRAADNGESDVEGDRKDRSRRASGVSSRQRRTSTSRTTGTKQTGGGGESEMEGGGERQPGRRSSTATDSRRCRATRRASQSGGGDGESKGSKSSEREQEKEPQRNRSSRPSSSSSEVNKASSERIQAHRRRKRDLERRRNQERRKENS